MLFCFMFSASYKQWLKFCFIMHYLLLGLMLTKLADDILDRLDIFVLELQELNIPKPLLWEWIWSLSALCNFFAHFSLKKNNVTWLKFYLFTITLTAVAPLLYAIVYFFSDFLQFIKTREKAKLDHVWNDYPLSILWYVFIAVAIQVHLAEVKLTMSLLKIWSRRAKKE